MDSASAAHSQSRPCEVLHGGRWVRGCLLHWYRDPRDRRWRGVVQYTTEPGSTYVQPRDASQLRPASRG